MDTPAAMWNRVADQLASQNNTTLTQNARLLALMNIALRGCPHRDLERQEHLQLLAPDHGNPGGRRPDLDTASANARIPGVSLRTLGSKQRRGVGTRLLLRRRHTVQRHLRRAPRHRAGLHILLLRRATGRRRTNLRRLPLPILRHRRRDTRRPSSRLRHPNTHATHPRKRGRPAAPLTDRRKIQVPAAADSRVRPRHLTARLTGHGKALVAF